MSYVYIIEAEGQGLYKIGRSKDPDRRLRELQASSAFPLIPRATAHCQRPLLVERSLHRCFADCRQHGEWFKLRAGDAVDLPALLAEAIATAFVESEKPHPRLPTRTEIPPDLMTATELRRRIGCSRQTLDNYRFGHTKGERFYLPVFDADDWTVINNRIYFRRSALVKIEDPLHPSPPPTKKRGGR